MRLAAHRGHSTSFRLAGIFLSLAFYGCSADNSSSGGGDGGTPDGGSGGSSSSGSGGEHGSGGTTGSSGSGGYLGSGGATGTGGRSGSGGSSAGSGGAPSGTGGMSSGGGGAGPPHCNPVIQIVSPTSQPIEAGTDTIVRVQVFANESPMMQSLTWTWMVSDPLGQNIGVTTPDKDPTQAEFLATRTGGYLVTAAPSGDPRCAQANLSFNVSAPQGPSFDFRASASGYPSQDKIVKLADSNGVLRLQPGKPFIVKPIDALQGTLLNTYVRISSSNQAFTLEGNTTSKPLTTTLVASQTYSLLIAPLDVSGAGGAAGTLAFAPYVQSSLPASWSAPQELRIDQGTQLSGQALTAGGAPLQNARMQLRSTSGAPSTIGFSDASGAMIMWARDSTLSAIVAPPDGSGLPVATTAEGAISTNGGPTSLTMQWAAMAKGTLTVQVQGADGVSPIANAQVRLASSGMPYSAGTLTVHSASAGDVQVPTTASVTDSLSTAQDGSVTFPPFPPGVYTLTIIPPAAAAPAAVTTVPLTLTAGAVTQTIALARKVALIGTVTPQAGAAGAQVTAIDVGNVCTANAVGCPRNAPTTGTSAATGSVFFTVTDGTGGFSLPVDPDRTYEVIVQPSGASSSTLGRAVWPAFRLCSTATPPCTASNVASSLGTVALPAGMQYHGVLTDDDSGSNVGGASIQVFCTLTSPTCDPDVSLTEATSLGDGTFNVVLPVPAQTSAALSK